VTTGRAKVDLSGANGLIFEDALSQALTVTVSAGKLSFTLASETAAILVPKAP
jgi:hypothetical protein